jgi:hypothetical protein
MSCYIGIYIKHHNLCNWTKVQCQRPIGELHPSETPEAPWDTISVNFIFELPESHGYDTIMCVIDSLTKHAHFIPTHITINAEGTALLFFKEVWKHHGTPQVVVSDRGPQFVTGFTRELYKLPGIKLAMLTAYHCQTDGQTECVNQVLEGVRGHSSISLLPLSSPTLHLCICIPPPHLCTIFKDRTYSRRLLGPMV